jgi:hypothetical protein
VATLAREQHEEVRSTGPDGQAAKQGREETEVQGSASGLSLYLHRVAVGLAILVVASIQLAWPAVLGYGFVELIT